MYVILILKNNWRKGKKKTRQLRFYRQNFEYHTFNIVKKVMSLQVFD